MASSYQTAVSWAIVLAAAAALTYYYRPEAFHRLLPDKDVFLKPQPAENKASNKTKQKALKVISQDETKHKTTGGKRVKDHEAGVSSAIKVNGDVTAQAQDGQVVTLRRDEDGAMSDKDFARDLKRAQAGTKLEPKAGVNAKQGKRKRDYKDTTGESTASEGTKLLTDLNTPSADSPTTTKPVVNYQSETSSTTGREGDDDVSPAGSPLSTAATSRAGDISDMLEPVAPKPMTLSITNVDTTKKPKTQPQRFETAETKKQRQRRLKREQEKLEIQRSTTEHEKKKQNQLRTARMADGSSAQLRTNSFRSPEQNAWKSTPQVQSTSPPDASATQLLDTMEPSAPASGPKDTATSQPLGDGWRMPEASSAQDVKSKLGDSITSTLGASGREARANGHASLNWADDVTEDELRRRGILKEADDEWQDVSAKKAKKRGPKADDTSSDASSGLMQSNGVRQQIGGNRFNSFVSQDE